MSDSDSGRESPMMHYRPRPTQYHAKLIDDDRNTSLHYAASKNDVSGVVNYLDKESTIVDPQNYLGWTPLMMACRKGHFETVKCLIQYRANATLKNKFGMNVFQIAVVSGNLEMVTYLLEHLLSGGVSKRMLEITFSVASLAILFRHQSILELLINKHFTINEGTVGTGITPFMFAHALEHDSAISTLLKHNVDTKKKNRLGHTAVDIATIRHQMKIIHSSDHRILTQSLAASGAAQQEYIQNEFQNQQLKNALQLKPDNKASSSPNVVSPQVYSSHPQVPYIVISPYMHGSHVKLLSVPNMIANMRKSSNVSPFPVPPPPNVTPISPAIFGNMTGQPQQVFFPPDFSPNQSPFSITSQVYNTMASQSYSNDFLNARVNSSAGLFFSPPVLNFLSPCM